MEPEKRTISAVSDQPVSALEGDWLANNKYAKGLCEFIRSADTPLTIGIQGGWGSGKTSLINLLGVGLRGDGDTAGDVLCININAWQHSLFHAGDQVSVALSLLQDMVEGIEATVAASPRLGKTLKEKIKESKLASGLTSIGRFAGGVAAVGLNMFVLHGLLSHLNEATEAGMKAVTGSEAESPAKVIGALRSKIHDAVSDIVANGGIKRIVFFVDDLDRVHPRTAVEILDVLKNVFDVPDCVFVLAIDFDVVIKGLEGKFGARTSENAREFRQYFDKIIQVPFSMPVSAYETSIRILIGELLKMFSFANSDEVPEDLPRLAWSITDGTPRSVKRIINTLSLLTLVKRAEQPDAAEGENPEQPSASLTGEALTVWFGVVGLQINFPAIYTCLERNADFLSWKPADFAKFEGDSEGLQLVDGKEFPAREGLSETFRKSLNFVCQRDEWLRAKEPDLVTAFSVIVQALRRMAASSRTDAEELAAGTPSIEFLQEVLSSASITSLDRTAPAEENESIRTDKVTRFAQRIHQVLAKEMAEVEPYEVNETYARRDSSDWGRGGRSYAINCRGRKNELLKGIQIAFKKSGRDTFKLFCTFMLKPPHGKTARLREILRGTLPEGMTYRKPDATCVVLTAQVTPGDLDKPAAEFTAAIQDAAARVKGLVASGLGGSPETEV